MDKPKPTTGFTNQIHSEAPLGNDTSKLVWMQAWGQCSCPSPWSRQGKIKSIFHSSQSQVTSITGRFMWIELSSKCFIIKLYLQIYDSSKSKTARPWEAGSSRLQQLRHSPERCWMLKLKLQQLPKKTHEGSSSLPTLSNLVKFYHALGMAREREQTQQCLFHMWFTPSSLSHAHIAHFQQHIHLTHEALLLNRLDLNRSQHPNVTTYRNTVIALS